MGEVPPGDEEPELTEEEKDYVMHEPAHTRLAAWGRVGAERVA